VTDLQTRTPDQLPAAVAISPNDLTVVQSPLGPVLKIPVGDLTPVLRSKRPEAPAVQRLLTSRSGDKFHAAEYGCTGSYAHDATQSLADMNQYLQDGAEIDFGGPDLPYGGDYRVTDTWFITRHLRPKARFSRLVGVMADNTKDLVHIRPAAEVRNMVFTGWRLGFNSGGRTALRVGNHNVGFLHAIFDNLQVNSGPGGWGIELEGVGTHFNTLRNNYVNSVAFLEDGATKVPLRGSIKLNCADATKVYDNLTSGVGVGCLVDIVSGAQTTAIHDNGFVNRDGGLFHSRGGKVRAWNNTYEQSIEPLLPVPGATRTSNVHQGTYKAHIVAYGSAYATAQFTGSVVGNVLTVTAIAQGAILIGASIFDAAGNISPHIRISVAITGGGGLGTYRLSDSVPTAIPSQTFMLVSEPIQTVSHQHENFGSGSNNDASVILVGNTESFVFDQNDYCSLGQSGADIISIGNTNKGHIYGDRGTLGGLTRAAIASRGTVNTLDPRDLFRLTDNGVESYGYVARKGAAALGALGGGWTASPSFAFWTEQGDHLHFKGNLLVDATAGANGGGYLIGNLPLGSRVKEQTIVSVPNSLTATPSTLVFYPNGDVRCNLGVNSSSALYMAMIPPIPVQGRSTYFSTPI
jgi:hypothetical protein